MLNKSTLFYFLTGGMMIFASSCTSTVTSGRLLQKAGYKTAIE